MRARAGAVMRETPNKAAAARARSSGEPPNDRSATSSSALASSTRLMSVKGRLLGSPLGRYPRQSAGERVPPGAH